MRYWKKRGIQHSDNPIPPEIIPNPDVSGCESESGRASMLQQLIDHWKAYFYRQSGEISESNERYIEKFAYELDLLVMNLTGKDMMAQGQILKDISKSKLEGENFVHKLSEKSEGHMLEIVKSVTDSHLDYTVCNLHKLIHVAGEFYNLLYEEQLIREQKRELGSV